jgi:ubiquinone/menaquinone biosynthesis C-methylase UbiE
VPVEFSSNSTARFPDDREVTDPWEAAYLRFETPAQEIKKFERRLKRLGADKWPRNLQMVELFCGRGNGLNALQQFGFTNLTGVDRSPRLVAEYRGPAKCIVADCRLLPFCDKSKDVLIVQGGLHHLPTLPADLDVTFAEMHRVMRPTGLVLFIEPWLTPFLRFVHTVSANSVARRVSAKLDALATMIEYEKHTYDQWLAQPGVIQRLAHQYFSPIHESVSWGKWRFLANPRALDS